MSDARIEGGAMMSKPTWPTDFEVREDDEGPYVVSPWLMASGVDAPDTDYAVTVYVPVLEDGRPDLDGLLKCLNSGRRHPRRHGALADV